MKPAHRGRRSAALTRKATGSVASTHGGQSPTQLPEVEPGQVYQRPTGIVVTQRAAGEVDRALAQAGSLLLRVYQILLSPLLGPHCRFEPSCSRYAREALGRFGFLPGVGLAVSRVARCHPWNAGGHDPVPMTALGPEAPRNG